MLSADEAKLSAFSSVIMAIRILEHSLIKIVLVIDEQEKLIGTITDSDIRSGLLQGVNVQASVESVMQKNPVTFPRDVSRQIVTDFMIKNKIKWVSLIDPNGKVAGVAFYDMLTGIFYPPRSNKVLIIEDNGENLLVARSDYSHETNNSIEIKSKLELILLRFIHYGFTEFIVITNYNGHMIENRFGSGRELKCSISYLAGYEVMEDGVNLSFLIKNSYEPMLIINGNILPSVNFLEMLDYHTVNNNIATICVRHHRVKVLHDVIKMKDGNLKTIDDKAVYDDIVDTGIYTLEPQVFSSPQSYNITNIFTLLISLVQNGQKVSIFSVPENWVDVDTPDDLIIAKRFFA